MRVRYPKYYKTFRCIASDCPDSCCKEWEVLVDDVTATAYRQMEGSLGQALREYLYTDGEGDWYLRITDGRCPMWRSDGLCRIQAEQGHDALCETCREFPRLKHDYGDFMELGLEMSCPEAARIIFEADPRWEEKEMPGGETPEYDEQDMQLLLQTREYLLRLLEDRRYSVPEVLALMLLYGYRAQDGLDGGQMETFVPEAELVFANSVAKAADPGALTAFYSELEILTDAWRQRLLHPQGTGQWDERLRILARYGVERYYLQAISDFDLVGRVKMVVASCLLVQQLGGDPVQTAQLYGKEIENNMDNVEAILDGAYTHPALTDEKLLGALLTPA
ncbi:MAG: hypothetical protein E7438_05460 [Ruminococcaceae bacterium]|nr:hypothetical protein [Oscillospiraceae bacterium]